LPAGLLFVLLVDRGRLIDWRLVLKGVSLFLLGLLFYLYLPVRAAMDFTRGTLSVDPTLMRYDPSTLEGFVTLVTGGDFKGSMFVFGPAELPTRVAYYLGYLLEQFHPWFLAVALLGITYLLVVDRAAIVLLGILYLGWLFYALEYDISDVYYQFIPTYLILAVFTAAGFAALLSTLEKLMANWLGRVRTAVAVTLVSAAVLLAPFVGISETYAKTNRSEDYEGRRAIEAVATKTESEATVIHHRSPLWYMNLVEGRRRDITLVASFHLTFDEREVEAAKAALETGSAYILYPSTTDVDLMKEAGLDLASVEAGMLYEVVLRESMCSKGCPAGTAQ